MRNSTSTTQETSCSTIWLIFLIESIAHFLSEIENWSLKQGRLLIMMGYSNLGDQKQKFRFSEIESMLPFSRVNLDYLGLDQNFNAIFKVRDLQN